MNLNLPDGWMIYPLAEVTIGLFVILIIMLIVQIKIFLSLRSIIPPKEKISDKKQMDNLTFKDMR